MRPDRIRFPFKSVLGVILVLAVAGGIASYISAKDRKTRILRSEQLTGGRPMAGLAAMEKYGCGSCHNVKGLPRRPTGIAPDLEKLSSRAYIGGVIDNTPRNLVNWIINPPAVDPLTAMPAVGVTEEDARHIAAYLYYLE